MRNRINRCPAPLFQAAIVTGICLLLGAGCVKPPMEKATAALDILHAVEGAGDLRPSFQAEGHSLFQYSPSLTYNTFYPMVNRFGSYTGPTRLRLYELPDTTTKDQPLFDLQLDLPEASVNTLVLTGTKEAPEALFIRETIPYFANTDSVMAIRFINCSPGSGPVTIHLKGGGIIDELSHQAFRHYSPFTTLPVRAATTDYELEARDAVTGDLLATFQTAGMATGDHGRFRYRSFSLLLVGRAGATGVNAPAFLLLPHFKTL